MEQAVFVRSTGGPEVLSLEPHAPGEPGAGEVRVRVSAAHRALEGRATTGKVLLEAR